MCQVGYQVDTPVGQACLSCGEAVADGDQGMFSIFKGRWVPVHRECALRDVLGGIGHWEDHKHWCREMHDPDGGRSRRQSALEVWNLQGVTGANADA